MKDKFNRYICNICKKPTPKKELEDKMCRGCWDKQEVYQIFKNGKYKKLIMESLWDWLNFDEKRELFGVFLIVYQNHNHISIVRIDGNVGDYNEYLETDIFPVHIKTMCKILK